MDVWFVRTFIVNELIFIPVVVWVKVQPQIEISSVHMLNYLIN